MVPDGLSPSWWESVQQAPGMVTETTEGLNLRPGAERAHRVTGSFETSEPAPSDALLLAVPHLGVSSSPGD